MNIIQTQRRKQQLFLVLSALSACVVLSGCSKKAAAPLPATSQNVNIPQFLATVQSLPPEQRKEYVKQHPAEEQAVLMSDDPQQTQALTNLLATR